MNDAHDKWQFGIVDVLALVTMVAVGLGLFSILRGVAPIVNPTVIGVLLFSMLGASLAGFWGRKRPVSARHTALCVIVAVCCAVLLASLVFRYGEW